MPRLLALIVAVLALSLAVCGNAQAVTAEQAIGFLNAQRAANGLPADIVEDPQWSEGCRLHANYMSMNGWGANPHDEDPAKPGYTPAGQQAARSSVLGSEFSSTGDNGWQNAPIHFMQLMGPGLLVTGYSDGCMWTWPGYQRPKPAAPQTYSFPGDGGTGLASSQNASESPFVPGDFVGLPQGTTTGPHLYVLAFGQGNSASITAASLNGPDGPVEVRTVDNFTTGPKGNLGQYLPPGGIVIPVAPLRPNSAYTASVTLTFAGQALQRTWSFTTASPPSDGEGTLGADDSGGDGTTQSLYARTAWPRKATKRVARGTVSCSRPCQFTAALYVKGRKGAVATTKGKLSAAGTAKAKLRLPRGLGTANRRATVVVRVTNLATGDTASSTNYKITFKR